MTGTKMAFVSKKCFRCGRNKRKCRDVSELPKWKKTGNLKKQNKVPVAVDDKMASSDSSKAIYQQEDEKDKAAPSTEKEEKKGDEMARESEKTETTEAAAAEVLQEAQEENLYGFSPVKENNAVDEIQFSIEESTKTDSPETNPDQKKSAEPEGTSEKKKLRLVFSTEQKRSAEPFSSKKIKGLIFSQVAIDTSSPSTESSRPNNQKEEDGKAKATLSMEENKKWHQNNEDGSKGLRKKFGSTWRHFLDEMSMYYFLSGQERPSDFKVIQHLYEAGTKLESKPQTIAAAATLYHRFFKAVDPDDYECYLIAATCMYLAGKVEEDQLKIRDVVNVFYKILHKDSEPLELGEKYWSLRDSIVQCELLILRMLQFKVHVDHPHRYLLHYLRSIYDWLDPDTVAQVPIARTCWSLLADYYHDPVCLKHDPRHVAVAIIEMSLQTYAVSVPYSNDAVLSWQQAFCEDLTVDHMWDIMEDVMGIYDKENEESK